MADQKIQVIIDTSAGEMKLELWADLAPKTVANFLQYVDDGFFDGTIFHRAIPDFMIQGGGFTADMEQKRCRGPIKNEASAQAKNAKGTIAMARTGVVDSATAQFFINVADNDFLDHKDDSSRGFGYAVFGKVIEGQDVADKISKVKTGNRGGHENVPVQPVVINSIKRAK
jgi:cyclophilin family peptidyl-prolyl cis-trans isomerase